MKFDEFLMNFAAHSGTCSRNAAPKPKHFKKDSGRGPRAHAKGAGQANRAQRDLRGPALRVRARARGRHCAEPWFQCVILQLFSISALLQIPVVFPLVLCFCAFTVFFPRGRRPGLAMVRSARFYSRGPILL